MRRNENRPWPEGAADAVRERDAEAAGHAGDGEDMTRSFLEARAYLGELLLLRVGTVGGA